MGLHHQDSDKRSDRSSTIYSMISTPPSEETSDLSLDSGLDASLQDCDSPDYSYEDKPIPAPRLRRPPDQTDSCEECRGGGSGGDDDERLTRECRDFYERRLKTMETLNERWRLGEKTNVGDVQLDQKMNHLRREIACLMGKDNELFQQLLDLQETVSCLKEQRYLEMLDEEDDYSDDDEDEYEELDENYSYSLSPTVSDDEADADADTSSPTSTLSSGGSNCRRVPVASQPSFTRPRVSYPPTAKNRRPQSVRYVVTRPPVTVTKAKSFAVSGISSAAKSNTSSNPTDKYKEMSASVLRRLSRPLFRRSQSDTTSSTPAPGLVCHRSQNSFDSGIHGSEPSDQEIFV